MKAEPVLAYLRELPRQAQSTLAVVSVSLLLLLWLLLSPLFGLWAESFREINNTRPRLARLIGFEESGEILAASLRKARAQLDLLVYPQEGQASGAALQQMVRDIADESGLTVTRSQPLGNESLEGLERVRVSLELAGSAAAFDAFLDTLAATRPVVVADSIRLQPARQRRGDAAQQTLAVSVRLSAYRVAPQ